MGRRQFAVLGGLMMLTGALVMVAPVSTGVAPAHIRTAWAAGAEMPGTAPPAVTDPGRPVPIRSVT